jgi:hypothetical protein
VLNNKQLRSKLTALRKLLDVLRQQAGVSFTLVMAVHGEEAKWSSTDDVGAMPAAPAHIYG